MIDVYSQIFTAAVQELTSKYPGIKMTGEVSDQVSTFPCVQIEESSNVPTWQDNGPESLYAAITLRVRVHTSKAGSSMTQAREILSTIDGVFEPLNIRRKTYVAQSGLYNNSAYRIEATYSVVASANGVLYRG